MDSCHGKKIGIFQQRFSTARRPSVALYLTTDAQALGRVSEKILREAVFSLQDLIFFTFFNYTNNSYFLRFDPEYAAINVKLEQEKEEMITAQAAAAAVKASSPKPTALVSSR